MSGFSFELAYAALLAVTGVAGIVFAVRGSRPSRGSRGRDSSRSSRSPRGDRVAIVVFLAAWLAGLLFMTLRPSSGRGSLLNLVPLSFEGPGAVVDAVLNVGVFVPLGLLLAAAAIRFPVALLIGLLLSVTIELSQFVVQVGRTSDINDLITNTTGTVLGWALGAAVVHIRRRVDG
ncbi:VanZ family protein [Agreia sp. PsM10]|uniref:VanZ family protein n=1 Tax=Agreia sp. PsM10 TaxID=3030533 RepID=UPI00263BA855|nr:VanZ family protein [Agreia sp. PsM10]MDN4639790.1 VanZ family protein [Agreia sp. PsM10]